MVSFQTQKINSKLTDFEDLKDYVVKNSIKNIPRAIKPKPTEGDACLASF